MRIIIYSMICFVFLLTLQSCENQFANENEILQQENIEALTKSYAVVCVDLYVQWDDDFLYLGTACNGQGISGGGGGATGSIAGGYDPDDIVESPPYNPPSTPGAGGGSSHYNPNTGNQEYVYDNLTHIYAFGSTLDLAQKERLNKLMGNILSISINKKLYDYMIARNVKIKFHHNPKDTVAALYNVTTKSITINNFNTLNVNELQEELVHAVQHQCFYGNSMNGKYKNYEFEAKVYFELYSVINGIVNPLIGTDLQTPEFTSKYTDWLTYIAVNMKGRFTDSYGFNELCKSWTRYKGETLPNFKPALLLELYRKPVPPQQFHIMNISINHQ